ncbi:MAG: MGMT family protein [Candidatus Omnitrophica bacterium]|nr:MGMT family protein [Candidatus Omnitrophota bacterium]
MTPFAKKVYRVVLSIPLGEVRTYQWVARRAGNPRAHRAVGSILKKNPYPLLIPCHRVVKSNGDNGEYAYGGKRVKQGLLNLERQIKDLML